MMRIYNPAALVTILAITCSGCLRSHDMPPSAAAPATADDVIVTVPVSTTVPANESAAASAADLQPAAFPFEETLVVDIWGNRRLISDFQLDDTRAFVFIFLGTQCPLAKLNVPTLIELENEFRPQGIQFLGVFSNDSENLIEIAAYAHDFDLPFPVVRDPDQQVASHLNVERTPEVVVLDTALDIQYRGLITDQYRTGGRLPEAKNHYLRDALTELVSGHPITTPLTSATGCLIDHSRPAPDEPVVTFAKHVAPILQEKCQTCHRPGQVGPFPLLTYEQARRHVYTIAEVVEDRRMPPWLGFTNEAKVGKLSNDISLTSDEVETILAWVRTGALEGDPADLPPPVEWPSTWQLDDPDLILEMEQPYDVPADGVLPYTYFQIPTNFKEDQWISAVEVRPGDPSVVHHILVHDSGLRPKRLFGLLGMVDLYGSTGEDARVVAQFNFGDNYTPYPPGHAMLIPAGSYLTLEVHYTPNGTATQDRSQVALKLAGAPPQHAVRSVLFTKRGFTVPANHPHTKLENSWTFEHTSRILSVKPHTHLRAKHFRFSLKYPDGQTATLLAVPRWNFDWQLEYRFADPPTVPKGTQIIATAVLDNSALNPNNPDPNAEVKWGLQSWDEMLHARISIVELPGEDTLSRPRDGAAGS